MLKLIINRLLAIFFILGALHTSSGASTIDKDISEKEKAKPETVSVVEADSTDTEDNDGSQSILDRLSTDNTETSTTTDLIDDDPEPQETGSIVSFNLIYYLIEKFKFSDLLGL